MNKDQVENIAQLARLRLPQEEKEIFTEQILNILDWVDTLKEADTDGIEPVQPMIEKVELAEDKVEEFDNIESILNNAPASKNNLFKVKKVLS